MTSLVDRALSAYGRLDVLVTSAGVQARGTIDELSVAELRACLDVNVVGTWLACRAAAVPMRDAGYGRVLTLASAPRPAAPVGYAACTSIPCPARPACLRRCCRSPLSLRYP